MSRATVLCAALLLAGGPPASAETDRQTRTFALAPGQPVALEITIGQVRIEGWARTDAFLEITRTAPTAADLRRIPLDIREQGGVLIRARQSDGGTDPALRTDVTLRVPHHAVLNAVRIVEGRLSLAGLRGAITADIQRGPIEAQGLEGTIRLETTIGDITARNVRVNGDGVLRLRTFNGNVLLQLAERPQHARVMALALNGTVASEIPLRMKDSWGPRWGEATIGRGEPVIAIDVITGRIEIRAPAG